MKLKKQIAIISVMVVLIGAVPPGAQLAERLVACASIHQDGQSASSISAQASAAYAELKGCLSSIPGQWYATYEPSFVYENAWPYGQEIEATLAMMQINPTAQLQRDLDREIDGLRCYWEEGAPGGYDSAVRNLFGSEPRYYDDNAWIGIALLEAYEFEPKNRWLLDRAEQIFRLEEHGAENTSNLPDPGGVFWTQMPRNSDRGTVSTAGACQLALRLYRLTHADRYLKFAEREFAWVDRTLLAKNGLYQDHIRSDGSKDETEWSYNQGLMIGDAVLLYLSTGDHHYLAESDAIAAAAVEHYSLEMLYHQPPIFNAILFKNLLILNAVAPDSRYYSMISAYAPGMPEDDVRRSAFVFGHDLETASLDQSAKVQVLALLWLIASGSIR